MFKEFSLECLVVGSSLIGKKENLAEMVTLCHSFSFVVTRCTTCCHSLSLVVTRCHSLYHSLSLAVISYHPLYHSLSGVVTRCTTRCHSLSTRCSTRLSFYKRSIQQPISYLRCFCVKLLVRCLMDQNTYLEKKLFRFYDFFILKKKIF